MCPRKKKVPEKKFKKVPEKKKIHPRKKPKKCQKTASRVLFIFSGKKKSTDKRGGIRFFGGGIKVGWHKDFRSSGGWHKKGGIRILKTRVGGIRISNSKVAKKIEKHEVL